MDKLGHIGGRIGAICAALMLVCGTVYAAPDGNANARLTSGQGVWLSSFDQLEHLIKAYDAALALAPGDAEAWRGRADSYRALGRPRQALEDYGAAIALAPDAKAYFGRAMILAASRLFDDALTDFDAAIAAAPDFADAYFQRGRTYHRLGRNERADADFATAVRLDPDHAWAYRFDYRHGMLYKRRVAEHHTALRHIPDDAKAFFNRGVAYRYHRQYRLAALDFDEVIRRRPDYAQAYFLRANCYSALGLYDQAMVDYNRAIALKPDFAMAWFYRGRALVVLGRPGSAADFATAKRLEPANPIFRD
jgi:tetratricopeptide (TPR) repeat protein